jgi:hypothetical protein
MGRDVVSIGVFKQAKTVRRIAFTLLAGVFGGSILFSPAFAETEWERLTRDVLAPPPLKAEAGFQIKLLVPPGEFYDPLYVIPRGDGAWVSDDGGVLQKGDFKGGQLVEVSATGEVKVLVKRGEAHPLVGIDIAPKSLGPYAGQIYMIGERRPGTTADVIQRIDPANGFKVSDVCDLPDAPGKARKAKGAFEGRFGPEGSPFQGRFFVTTAGNDTVYQVKADGTCATFVVFDGKTLAHPWGLVFAEDGKSMLVSVQTPSNGNKTGAVVRIYADGRIDDKRVVETEHNIGGFGYAPKTFGKYGGHLFLVTSPPGIFQEVSPPKRGPDGVAIEEGPMLVRGRQAKSSVSRIAPDGSIHPVASGFIIPVGLQFFKDKMWVTDVSGDFWNFERRQMPDGFIAEIRPE